MTAQTPAEKLAEVIAGHGIDGALDDNRHAGEPESRTRSCRCDRKWVTPTEYAAHLAAVVLAWLEGQGWRYLPLVPLTPAASGKHYGHETGEWFYGCNACNPITPMAGEGEWTPVEGETA